MASQEEQFDVKKIQTDRIMQEKLFFSILSLEREKTDQEWDD